MVKKYDVYGLGNALVDMEFEVSSEFLQKMNVEKGLMTLVDEERQSELLLHLDRLQHRRSCGGSAANTMIALAQLGGKSFYSCKVAADEVGDFYCTDLSNEGVHTNLSKNREAGVTGRCMVFVTPDADRTMNTFLGITGHFSKSELVIDELLSAQWVYIEGYLVTSPNALAAAIEAKEQAERNGVLTALTFSDPGIVAHFKNGFDQILGGKGVDLLFCNEQEAFAYTGASTMAAASECLKKVAKKFAVTLGSRGAYVFDGTKEIEIITHKVEAVDTNGAGDLFAGAFLYAISNGHSFNSAGRLACQCASKLVTQFGARLQKQQAQEILKEVL